MQVALATHCSQYGRNRSNGCNISSIKLLVLPISPSLPLQIHTLSRTHFSLNHRVFSLLSLPLALLALLFSIRYYTTAAAAVAAGAPTPAAAAAAAGAAIAANETLCTEREQQILSFCLNYMVKQRRRRQQRRWLQHKTSIL